MSPCVSGQVPEDLQQRQKAHLVMHPAQSSDGSTSDEKSSARSFMAFDHSISRPPHHVSLSQPCLPVANLGPTKILPYLFLGSQSDAHCVETMAQNGITYVLNVSVSSPRPAFIQDGHFLRISVNDSYSDKLSPFFSEAFQFLDKVREANGRVLVHCLAGVSRSPTLAIAYIMSLLKMTMDEAYRYVKDKRPTISPNFNFLGQLLEYEKQLTAKESDIPNGHLETMFSKWHSADSRQTIMPRPNDCQQEVKFLPAQAGHVLTLTSPTTALARLNFSHLSPLKEQPSPSLDEPELPSSSQASQANSVVTVRLGSKHSATKRPLSDQANDDLTLEENGLERINTKRPLMRPSSINFSSAPVTEAKQHLFVLKSSCGSLKDDLSDDWKTFLSPSPVVEQNYLCLNKISNSRPETSFKDGSKVEDSRLQMKENTWLPADDKCISKNNDQPQCKVITEQPDNGISAVDLSAPRPNKLLLPSWNLTVARTKISHPNTSGPLNSDVIKNCSSFMAQTTMTNRSSCGTAADLNNFAAITAARPTDLAVTFDCSLDCDDLSHSAMARKSRSLEDILSRPCPNETKNSCEQGILSNCKKHSSYWIKVLASPVAYGLDKHLLHCQVTKSDPFQSPSSSESPEMIFVS